MNAAGRAWPFDGIAAGDQTPRVRLTFLHPKLDFTDGTARLIASVRASLAAGHEVNVISQRGSCTSALLETGAHCFEGELPTQRFLGAFASGRTRDQVAELAPDLLQVTDESLAPLATKVADALHCPYIQEVVRPIEVPVRVSNAHLRAVLLPCETFAERAVNKGNLPRPRLQVIAHGPDLSGEWQPKPVFEGRRPVVLCIGTLDEDHGIDVLIAAAAILKQAGRKTNFLVLGEGPQENRFRRQVRELELGEMFAITSPGLRDVKVAMEQADLHVACPRRGSLGWYAVQAMGMGIPSLVSAIGGVFPLVEDRVDAMLVEGGDAAKLAEGLEVLLANERAARGMGVRAREKMLEWDRQAAFDRELAQLQGAAMGVAVP